MSGATSRRKGIKFEQDIRLWCRSIGFTECETSRFASKKRDDECVDFVGTEPFSFQAKYTQTINMHTELSKMPDDGNYNVVLHKRKNKGAVACMSLEDFEELIKMLKHNLIV